MNWKRIGRAAICLLLVCCLVLHLSPIKAEALALELTLGTVVAVGGVLAIGAIMIGLGVHIGISNTDFWDLAEDIYDSLLDQYKKAQELAGYGVQKLVVAWLYENTYYLHENVVRHVNDYLTDSTSVSYDQATSTVVSDAPIRTEYVFKGSSNSSSSSGSSDSYGGTTYIPAVDVTACVNDALAYGLQNYSASFQNAANADYCYYIELADGRTRVAWSSKPATVVDYTDTYDITIHTPCWYVEYTTDGEMKALNSDERTCGAVYYERASYEFSTDLDLSLGNVQSNIIDFSSHVKQVEDSDPDDGDNGGKYLPIKLLPDKDAIEDMTQEEALNGSDSAPDVVVDAETGVLIDSNVDNSWLLEGKEVGVDAEIAVSSMLIALGISPGSANTEFRALVDNVIAELPKEYFYDFESLAYGNLSLLRCWLCDDKYYFTEDVLEYINGLLYNGSDTMDPIFKDEGFFPDSSKYPEYSILLDQVEIWRNRSSVISNSYAEIFDTSRYLGAMWRSSDSHCVFVCSPNPISLVTSGSYSYFVGEGPYIDMYYSGAWCIYGHDTTDSFESPQLYSSGSYYGYTDIYTSGLSLAGDLFLFDSAPSLSDLLYGSYTVEVDGVNVTYYPVKLFETLEAAEAATQNEVQAGLDSSTWLTVDTSTGTIIDVLPDIEPDPDPDPAPDVDPDPTTPAPAPGTDPDTGDDTDTDTGADEGTDSGTLEDILQGHRTNLLEGLRAFFEWLGEFIVSGFNNAIEWLGNTFVYGMRRVAEWMVDAIASVLHSIFVPSEDFLTAKVDALRARFGFADSIVATVAAMGDALNDFQTSPPIIYMELSNAESKYDWGDRAIALDLRWYERYKPAVDVLLSALLWIFFIWRVFRKLPGIISGMEGDSPFAPIFDGRFGSSSSNMPRLGSGPVNRRK